MADVALLKSVLPPRLAQHAQYFVAAEVCFGTNAILLAAICDRESRGGDVLTPTGPTGTGDMGHGRGLMQIDDRSHQSFLVAHFPGTDKALWQHPAFNVIYGAWLLAEYTRVTGDIRAGVAAYNAGLSRVLKALPGDTSGLTQRLDLLTTGGNYVSDVLRRKAQYEAAMAKA